MIKEMKKIVSLITAYLFSVAVLGQKTEDQIRSTGFPQFPVITNAQIPGAPILEQPFLVNGTKQEIRTEKHGLAYPAFYDWNHDGKTDLLLGEFETGKTGSFIKVYLNDGTDKK